MARFALWARVFSNGRYPRAMHGQVHDDGPDPPELSEEDAEFRRAFADLVDYYRVNQSAALWRAFWPGALVLLPLGCAITALSVAPRIVPSHLSLPVALLGLGVTGAGPLWCMLGLFRAIRRDDLYVAIRTQGVCLRLDPARPAELVPWDDIEEVRYDGGLACVMLSTKGQDLRIEARFAELSLEELARRLRDARRLAVWQRLVPKWSVP
jgi:hypothetical protein